MVRLLIYIGILLGIVVKYSIRKLSLVSSNNNPGLPLQLEEQKNDENRNDSGAFNWEDLLKL